MTTPQQLAGYATPSLAAQAALAAAFKSQQGLLALLYVQRVIAVWGQLNLADVRQSWPALRVALAALVREGFARSAAAGDAYYAQARLAAGIATGDFAAPALPQPDQALITATLDSTGPYNLLAKIKAAQPVPQAMDNAAVQLSGAASRLIASGARQAILTSVQADRKAIGWLRVTSGNPCAWCAMLSGRGPTYRTEASASFLAHSHCACVAQPAFSAADAKALTNTSLQRQWAQATRGYSGQDAIRAWRRYWDKLHPDAPGAKAA